MSRAFVIEINGQSLEAELNHSPTAEQIMKALPISASAQCWGDEIYFRIPVSADLEAGAKAEVQVGDLAYWPPGQAFCIFFGRTPASTDETPRAASPVTVVGKVLGDLEMLRDVCDGEPIRLVDPAVSS